LASTFETALQKAALSFATTTFILGSRKWEGAPEGGATTGSGLFLTTRKMALHLLQRSLIPSAPTFFSSKLNFVLHPGHTISIKAPSSRR
jgi:hypothetical protein